MAGKQTKKNRRMPFGMTNVIMVNGNIMSDKNGNPLADRDKRRLESTASLHGYSEANIVPMSIREASQIFNGTVRPVIVKTLKLV